MALKTALATMSNNQIFGPVEITESKLLSYDQNWTALIKENFVTEKLETEEIFV